jgi:hypothetical protein
VSPRFLHDYDGSLVAPLISCGSIIGIARSASMGVPLFSARASPHASTLLTVLLRNGNTLVLALVWYHSPGL